MKIFILIQWLLICSLFSCTNDTKSNRQHQIDEFSRPPYSTDTSKLTKEYVATGFYLLADKLDGNKMRMAQSDEVYSIAKKPSVSVDNILQCSLQIDTTENGIQESINMELDEKATQDFKEITGNPLYPYIAVVVANRLLYVVENQEKVVSGKTRILIDGYTKEEMQAMVDAISKKR
jgi:preprotein translocase subunit SecD